jgi:hypothetical protein
MGRNHRNRAVGVDARKLGVVAASALAAALLSAGVAEARCPKDGSPSREVCKYWSGLLIPSVVGAVYVPGDALGTWLGGGVQLVLFAWNDNSDKFGPGQGKIYFDIALLSSSEEALGKMIQYRGGINVSFEKNASRSWLIPYFGLAAGGMHEATIERHGFVDGVLGVHALYKRGLAIDLEGGYLFPFSDADALAGIRGQLAISFALW